MRITRERATIIGAAVSAVAAVSIAGTALAVHSMPAIPQYRDIGNDGSPDAAATLRTAGTDSYWTSVREDRLQYAVWQWDVYTDWNPTLNTTAAPADCDPSLTCQGIWIDGTAGCQAFEPGDLAHNCWFAVT